MNAPATWEAFEAELRSLTAQARDPRDEQVIRRWMDRMWQFLTESTVRATSMVGDDSELFILPQMDSMSERLRPFSDEARSMVHEDIDPLIGLQRSSGFGPLPQTVDPQQALSRLIASLDILGNQDRKEAVRQWVRTVLESVLPAHEQARLIGEFAPQVRGLKSVDVAESVWRLCLEGLAEIAARHRDDPALNERLLQIVETFPTLDRVRYPNNALLALVECRRGMRGSGYPQVVCALYLTAASQMAACLRQDAQRCSFALDNLLEQIRAGLDAGQRIPLQQIVEVLEPAIDDWAVRNSGATLPERWRAFVRDTDFERAL